MGKALFILSILFTHKRLSKKSPHAGATGPLSGCLFSHIGSSSRICRETDSASPISAISSMSEVPP